QAIVVDDPARAVASLLDPPSGLDSVWLLRAGAAWPLAAQTELARSAAVQPSSAMEPSGHAVVDLGYAVRVTRWPVHVSLGRAGRARRARDLQALAERLSQSIEASERQQQAAHEARRELE